MAPPIDIATVQSHWAQNLDIQMTTARSNAQVALNVHHGAGEHGNA